MRMIARSPRRIPSPHIPALRPSYPESQQGRAKRYGAIFGTKRGARARCWYAAMSNQLMAPLEPIEGDKHSDLSPLTREVPQRHLYGESIAAFGLSWP
jgi:hypothetical protein